ncbi:DNA topoisomerase, partial [Acinetobacter baumannii]|nr:DNA topoisomerase [Acinetobacter baumannii]
KEVYQQEDQEQDEEFQNLSDAEQGNHFHIDRVDITQGKTKPPAPFNEATLLSAMENPVKYMESQDARAVKTLGE